MRSIFTFSCDDQPGIVHAVTGAIVEASGNILELKQFTSTDTGRFFMRLEVDTKDSFDKFRSAFTDVAKRFNAQWAAHDPQEKVRTLVLVSKAGAPLNDLLFHYRANDLPIEIPMVLSNHPDLESLATYNGINFAWRHIDANTKPDFENLIRKTITDYNIELVVLARYMQILSAELCDELAGRAINIHHSFLPGFKGANPYAQAHKRGVKLIGATAHFVTRDLDEGPIIEQNVARVDHSQTVSQLRSIGQGLESATLTKAVRLFSQHRIFMDGNRTVIFE